MNRNLFRTMTWLMWLALPLTALRFWTAWGQLPLRMATHFDINWQPNGWMSREVALGFALGVTAFLLVVFTVVLFVMQKQQVTGMFSWVMLAFFYLVLGFVFAINSKVVSYNLTGQPMDLNTPMVLLPLAIVAFMGFYLYGTRGSPLPPSAPIAEELHASPLWGALIFVSAAGLLFAAAPARAAGFRIFAGLMSIVLVASAMSAWTGFHYSFSQRGLEIRTLGFRLRSIPAEQIERYAIEPWSFFRGYGIRGVGNRRAYVWGNSGVQINTAQGYVYLGHRDPGQIVRDLDMITQNRRGRE